MKQWIKDSFVIGCLVVIFILVLTKLEKCDRVSIDTNPIKPDTVTVHTSDTVYPEPIIIEYWKTATVTDSIYVYEPDSTLCNYVREYQDTIDDTNITIYTTDIIKGKLLESKLSYKLKIPIKIIDSVKTTITNTIEPKYQIYGGIQGGYKSFGPYIDFTKNKLQVGIGYDLYNKSPQIRVGYRLFNK